MGACSSFTCSSTDGRHFLGRTYDEYGTIDANRVAVIPRGHSVALTFTGDERQATDYAVVGMDVAMFPTPLLTDGVNEHGLMGAMLYSRIIASSTPGARTMTSTPACCCRSCWARLRTSTRWRSC